MFNPYCFTKCFNKIKSTESCPKKIYYEHPVSCITHHFQALPLLILCRRSGSLQNILIGLTNFCIKRWHDAAWWRIIVLTSSHDKCRLLFLPADMPKELRLQATRAAVLLLPDENREALRTLLCLLCDVTASVAENQMTPTNLAVCLAPSLFHLNTLRRKESSSPRCASVSSLELKN